MKTTFLIIAALIFSLQAFSQSFDSSRIRAGAAFIFASDFDNIGIGVNGVYSFSEKWEGAIAYTHIFEKDFISANVFDFDAHYIFSQKQEGMNFYALAGLAINSEKVKFESISASETFVGLNIGVGMNYHLSDKLNLAPEFRYTMMDGSYFRIGASLQYMF